DINIKLDLSARVPYCPLCKKPGQTTASTLEDVLGKLIAATMPSTPSNKNLFVGYQAAIAHLSETHPPNQFKTSWHMKTRMSDCGMLLGLYMDLLRSSSFIYDINVHQSVLKITCNLFLASDFYERTAIKGKTFEEGNPFLSNNINVCTYGTIFMQHIIAVLKLYQNIIDLSSSASPRKISTSPVISPVKKFSQKLEAEKKATESETDKKAKGPYFSSPLCQLHMRKINESIMQAWRVYRCSLDASATVKFTSLLSTCLNTLGMIFSVIRSDYPGMSSLIEDILAVTNSVFGFCPTDSLKCIRKVLQSVFAGYNAESTYDTVSCTESKTRERFAQFLSPEKLFKFPCEEKSTTISRSSAEVSALGAFIRQFEPAVVSGLRIYTTTSDTMVQVEVLRLLKQLINGHVNYGLVDSNQVFLGFVIKQITFLEEGQIRNANILVEEMFQFLTLLSHEHHATKSFIDVPKILNLCDILVSSDYGSNSGVKCLMPLVLDIIVKRLKQEHTNWEAKESTSHSDNLLQSIMKVIKAPEVLPVIWILLNGKRQRQDSKWTDDSGLVLKNILEALEKETLIPRSPLSFNCLLATLCALSNDAIPPVEELLTNLQNLIEEEVETANRFLTWISNTCAYWILVVKLSVQDDLNDIAESLTAGFVMKLLSKTLGNYMNVYHRVGRSSSDVFVLHFGSITYSLLHLLLTESAEELKIDLHSDAFVGQWLEVHESIKKVPDKEYVLRMCCIDLLSGISYPRAEILGRFLEANARPCQDFTLAALSIVMNDLNDGDVPSVEEWIITTHVQELLRIIGKPTVKTFLSRLSKFRRGQLLEKISEIVSAQEVPFEEVAGNILKYLKLVCDEFMCETAILGIELLKRLNNPYLELDASQFVCHALNHIHTRKLLFTHKDRDVIKSFTENTAACVRFPRLNILANAVLGDTSTDGFKFDKNMSTSMMAQWCCEEITAIEGLALAKMLSSLKYTQIMNIFSQRNFNLRVLHYCFVHLRSLYLMDIVSANDVTGLFTSELRSSLMDKWALGVACVEFVVETLDAWENVVADDLSADDETAVNVQSQPEFLKKLPLMWECLTAMLRLKKVVIVNTVPEDKGCYNNFIPTKIFTISFQYILISCNNQRDTKDIPVRQLRTFFDFASAAFSDSSFVSFFNVRDSPNHIFICVRSLSLLVKQLTILFSIDWNFNQINSDYYSEIDPDCSKVLIDFDYLMNFVHQVRCGRIKIDNSIFAPLRNVISGLGRCELINGWILISHLRWKPQASWRSQIFPPIEPIPLEILRSDHDLLLQYIFKLNVFGVASKIQFEENWVIFLSVINLYVDESFQLQIVSAGLKALSMLLQQCVAINYVDRPNNENLNRLVTKIDEIMDDIEPKLCKQISFPPLLSNSTKNVSNPHAVDVNSCIRFLTDLYTQWLQNPQGKMPLLLLSEVVRSIVVLSEYFEENSQFQWMYDTLMEIYKSFEKEDEVLWPHLIYGIFYSASKIELETEQVTTLAQLLESSITSSVANVAITGLKCGLVYLQNHPENLIILANIIPYALKLTQLDETSKDAESHSYEVWKLLLFVWVHGPQEGFGVNDYEQETLRNVLTVLSPLNKAYVSVRLLVLKALRTKVMTTELKSDVRKKITKVAYETLSTPNISIFMEALKLYTTIFYVDFYQFRSLSDPDPEVLMPMAERTEILFQLLKSGNKCNNQSVSKVLSLFILDFLPPSEILNRVIAEFMSPNQTAPELLAPVLAQVFEKSRRKPKEAALVREWILAGLPNFLNSADTARTMWSLTLFFIGVSSAPEVSTLLPFACLRRRTPQIQQLFLHSALDIYGTLDESRRREFRSTLLRNVDIGNDSSPFSYLGALLNKVDDQKLCWEIESCETP
ncbi:Huntingtin, partial [Orchesella cincta]